MLSACNVPCDAGEACGAYSSLQQPFELEVTAAGVGDLSIEATFVYDTATTTALQEVIPAAGWSRVVGQ